MFLSVFLKSEALIFYGRKQEKAVWEFAVAYWHLPALYVMSLFVWDIDFAGNMRYTDSYLLQFVKNEGYKPGMKISSVACDRLEKQHSPMSLWILHGYRLV